MVGWLTRSFAGSQRKLQQFEELIQFVVVALEDSDIRQQLEELISQFPPDLQLLAGVIRRILVGDRDEDGLCDDLDRIDSLIVGEVLKRLGANS